VPHCVDEVGGRSLSLPPPHSLSFPLPPFLSIPAILRTAQRFAPSAFDFLTLLCSSLRQIRIRGLRRAGFPRPRPFYLRRSGSQLDLTSLSLRLHHRRADGGSDILKGVRWKRRFRRLLRFVELSVSAFRSLNEKNRKGYIKTRHLGTSMPFPDPTYRSLASMIRYSMIPAHVPTPISAARGCSSRRLL